MGEPTMMKSKCNDPVFRNREKGLFYMDDRREGTTVMIFGGSRDCRLATAELTDEMDAVIDLVNCSVADLKIQEATEHFDHFAASETPDRLLLHLGEADLASFAVSSERFDMAYLRFLEHVSAVLPECEICLLSLENEDDVPVINEMNRHISNIAESERCGFVDLNHVAVSDAAARSIAFVYTIGFVRPLNKKISDLSLVRMIYGTELPPVHGAKPVPERVSEREAIPVFSF